MKRRSVGNGACAESRHWLRTIGELRYRQVPSSSSKFRNQRDADAHAKQEAQSNRIRGEYVQILFPRCGTNFQISHIVA